MTDTVRLLQLRRVVEDAPAHLFIMNDVATLTSCGTAYCAYGWALQDQWFRDNGLPTMREVNGDRLQLFVNLAEYFGLSKQNSDRLFGGDFLLWDEFDAEPMTDKGLVLGNIDRLIAGQDAWCYPGAEDEEDWDEDDAA